MARELPCPAAERDPVGVALHQPDEFVRDTETVGQDLRKRRLVTLPDGLGAGDQRHRTVGLEADVDILGRRATGSLDVIGKAEAAQQAAGLALAATRCKPVEIRTRQRML